MTTFCITLAMVAPLLAGHVRNASTDNPAQDFANTWYDGKAELCGYDYRVSRYGEERSGQAIAIFVTEPFSESKRVKLDNPGHAGDDAFTAMKLNLVRDFRTGIYDYNTMLTAIQRVEQDFTPFKLSFSSAEWCGHVYEELYAQPNGWQQRIDSYFEGESVRHLLPLAKDGVLEDQLFIQLRGLRGAPLQEGEKRSIQLMENTLLRRLRHEPADWNQASLERLKGTRNVKVPAGTFAAIRYELICGPRTGHFDIEAGGAKRLLAWRWERGGRLEEEGRLRGSERMPYWQLNREGQENQLERIGLEPNR